MNKVQIFLANPFIHILATNWKPSIEILQLKKIQNQLLF
jgi:hypothetical protein